MAREEPRLEWQALADQYGAHFGVVECICSDVEVHRSRVEGRSRDIPGWYELQWERVQAGREHYIPLADPKVVVDAVETIDANFAGRVFETGDATITGMTLTHGKLTATGADGGAILADGPSLTPMWRAPR